MFSSLLLTLTKSIRTKKIDFSNLGIGNEFFSRNLLYLVLKIKKTWNIESIDVSNTSINVKENELEDLFKYAITNNNKLIKIYN